MKLSTCIIGRILYYLQVISIVLIVALLFRAYSQGVVSLANTSDVKYHDEYCKMTYIRP